MLELAVADLESQVAIAETLPEAMERGDVTAEHGGYYTLASVASDCVRVSSSVISRCNKLASIPLERRAAYYDQSKLDNKRPSRAGLLKWFDERTVDVH